MSKVMVTITCIVTAISGFFTSLFWNVDIKSAEERVKDNETVFIASYNTAAPWGNALEGTGTSKRAKLFAQQINDTLPDSLGVQELNSSWAGKMKKFLPQYEYYGVKRGGDENEKKSEMNGIYYLKDKYELLESDTFWISKTPETESRYENAGCNRICSYVVLKNKATGFTYAHLNTHFDNVSTEAQTLGGRLVSEKASELSQKYENLPIVITGDFNQYSDGESCKTLENNGFTNASSSVENGDNMLTYNGWTNETVGRPIDFIFVNNGFTATDYKVHSDTGTKNNISDHYMISAQLK